MSTLNCSKLILVSTKFAFCINIYIFLLINIKFNALIIHKNKAYFNVVINYLLSLSWKFIPCFSILKWDINFMKICI